MENTNRPDENSAIQATVPLRFRGKTNQHWFSFSLCNVSIVSLLLVLSPAMAAHNVIHTYQRHNLIKRELAFAEPSTVEDVSRRLGLTPKEYSHNDPTVSQSDNPVAIFNVASGVRFYAEFDAVSRNVIHKYPVGQQADRLKSGNIETYLLSALPAIIGIVLALGAPVAWGFGNRSSSPRLRAILQTAALVGLGVLFFGAMVNPV
jgi:hypothetical protein